jgi:hypothetical protein
MIHREHVSPAVYLYLYTKIWVGKDPRTDIMGKYMEICGVTYEKGRTWCLPVNANYRMEPDVTFVAVICVHPEPDFSPISLRRR